MCRLRPVSALLPGAFRKFAPMLTGHSDYWNDRWQKGETGWDIGSPSAPLRDFIDTIANKNLRILIPGCGNAYEAEYLHSAGFTNVTIIDFAPLAIESFRERVPAFPADHLICGDFFRLDKKEAFDLIIEQTFFCAIDPSMRNDYAKKMHSLLAPGGELAGLLFNDPALGFENPPYGGSAEDYRRIFEPWFDFLRFSPAENSIQPRAGRELFIQLRKK